MENLKQETVMVEIDLRKLCRTCLNEHAEMRSVFVTDEATCGQGITIAEMLMGFTGIQVTNEDGLPNLVCLECIFQICRSFAFKQLVEQSDTNLRQYLGKPLTVKGQKQLTKKEESQQNVYNTDAFLVDPLKTDTSSDTESLDDTVTSQENFDNQDKNNLSRNEEKSIAQKQLSKLVKISQSKGRKRKLLISKSALTSGKKQCNACNVCRKQFVNFKAFRKHLRMHVEDRPFKCKQCSRSFTEENYLNNHMRTHLPDEEKPYECTICQRRFIHSTLLNKHLLRHTGEKPFICKICNKGCFAENSLLKHMKIHEKKEGDPALLKHICDYCRTEFPTADSLSIHIKQHTGSRPFLCNICGKSFPQRFNLDLHLRTHTGERPFKCEVCKNGYVSKASLKIHMRTHTNERPFVCDSCGKAFRQSGDLTSHKRLHGTDKPIECNLCFKTFTTVMKLKYHMRNHTGERPYVCNVCNRGFTVNTILLRHMRVHSGERPYVCVICGKAFSQSSTLNTHMRVHSNAVNKETEHQQQQPPHQTDKTDIKYVSDSVNGYNNHHNHEHQHLATSQSQITLLQDNHVLQENSINSILSDDNSHQTDASRLLVDTANLLVDNRQILTSGDNTSRLMNVSDPRLVVNVVESGRLLQDNRTLIGGNNRLMTTDTRLLTNVNTDNHQSQLGGNLVAENTRIVTKYLNNYDPYHHRGHI